ncbi:hypothetical protein [Streptomyces sp. NBC_00878]|uniref:hypothetical protein n=1 Tax=Streptomyces sp. NBC_00878 TaxID=2975854 RepID=UPI0022505331|nr:hypothetical protein [Streptomyces sp. NBC_00878]MCX4903405.1 hypothetical protein [Streptomyces sp. NBC_00878]
MFKRSLLSAAAVAIATLGVVALPSAAHATPARERTATVAADSQDELHPELDGLRIRAVDSADVYLVLDGKRHLIPSSVTYNALFRNTDGERLVLTTENITDGGPLMAYAYLARSTDDPTIYLVTNVSKREITSAAMDKFNFDRQKVRTTYPWVLAALPSDAPLT